MPAQSINDIIRGFRPRWDTGFVLGTHIFCSEPPKIQTYLDMLREHVAKMIDENHPTICYYSQKWRIVACFPKDFDSMSEEEAKHLLDMITVPRTKIDFLK